MRNIFTKYKGNKGFTIVELLVALSLVSLLMVVVVYGQLFLQRFLTGREQEVGLYEEANYIINIISDDVRNCREISRIDSTEYRIISMIFDTVDYHILDSCIHRNKSGLNSPDIFCRGINFEKIGFTKINMDSIIVDGGYTNSQEMVFISLRLFQKNKNEEFRAMVRLVRNGIY